MATIGVINLILTASTATLEKDLQKATAEIKKIGSDLETIGNSISVAITVPIAAAATAFVASAIQIDEALDTIRVRTGSIGADFEALAQDFEAVLGTVPASVDEVAEAISELAVRTGAVGAPLQEMTRQMLELANMTKTQVGPLIASTQKAFESFGIEVSKQPAALDQFWRAFQASQVPVQKLAELITTFGPQLRAMGFSFEEALGTVAAFEKGSVSTEKTMAGFNRALKEFAEAGIKDTRGALIATIEQIKNAATAAEGTNIAVRAFGKAGTEMAQDIREGKLEVTAMIEAIAKGPDTILKAAAATRGFGENMEMLRVQVTKALAPLGAEMLNAFESLQPAIEGAIRKVADIVKWFTDLEPQTKLVVAGVVGFAAALGPLIFILGSFLTSIAAIQLALGVGGLTGAFYTLAGGITPITIAIGAAAAVIITYKDEIAAAIVSTLEFVGIAQSLETQMKKVGFASSQNTEAFKRIAEQIGVSTDTLKQWMNENNNAVTALGKHKKEIEDLKVQLKAGTISQQDFEAALKLLIASENKQTDVQKIVNDLIKKYGPVATDAAAAAALLTAQQEKAKKELDNLIKSFEKSSAPMNIMAKDFKLLESAGKDFDDIVKANQDEIVKATFKQIAHGKALSENAQRYADVALAIDGHKKAAESAAVGQENFDKILKTFGATQEEQNKHLLQSIKNLKEVEKTLDEQIHSWDRFIREQDILSKRFVINMGEMGESTFTLEDSIERGVGTVIQQLDKLPPALRKSNEIMRQHYEEWKKGADATGKAMTQAISTAFTDMSKAITDHLFAWQGFWKSLLDIATDFAKGFTRIVIEGLFEPLKEKMNEWGKALGEKMGDVSKMIIGALQALGPVWGSVVAAAVAAAALIIKAWEKIPDAVQNVIKILIPAVGIISTAVKTVGEKMSSEIERDLGGLDISAKKIEAFARAMGQSIKTWEDVRKDIMFSPKFLTEIAFPIAEATGKVDEFLRSLEAVGTQWGTFNFRQAFEVGLLTGDFTELNKAFIEAFKSSKNLQAAMPEWRTELMAAAKSAAELAAEEAALAAAAEAAAAALKAAETELRSMGDAFLETGVMTDAFAAKIGELGGNMEIFQAAAQLPGLKKMLGEFTDLKSEVDKLLPKQLSMNEAFLETGHISDEMAANIKKAGGNLEVFRKFADVKEARDSFDDLIKKFKDTGVATDDLVRIIQTYGSEGVRNLQLTKDNVDAVAAVVKGDLNNAFVAAGSTLSAELDKMQKNLTQAINFLTHAIIQSMNAMVKALSGLPEEAAAIMNQLEKDFAEFQKNPINVKFTADTSDIDDASDRLSGEGLEIPVRYRTTNSPAIATAESWSPFDPRWQTVPAFQHGGIMPHTGLAFVHKGEEIKPTAGPWHGGGDVTINTTVHVHGNADRTAQEQMRRMLVGNTDGIREMLRKELGIR
jgi:phage-related minor tail protein